MMFKTFPVDCPHLTFLTRVFTNYYGKRIEVHVPSFPFIIHKEKKKKKTNSYSPARFRSYFPTGVKIPLYLSINEL